MTPKPFDWEDDDESEDDSEDLVFEDDDEDSDEFDLDDDDEDDGEADDDDDGVEDDDERFAAIERAFRLERANIRSCEDLHELRHLRASHQALANSNAREAGRIRARDLVDLIDDRITDLKARRMARRGR
jgi:hypothetical protein